MLPLRFVPYHELAVQLNVIVDGSATDGTVLVLSHWPGSPTPFDLLDDLSAQIAFRALAAPQRFDGVDAVSNNHFDQDGVVSAFALVDPDAALARRGMLVDVARAGDFATFTHRDAARVAFALAAYDDPDRSPLDADVFAGSYPDRCGRLYEAVLPQLAELVDAPERSRSLWETEDAHLDESLQAIATGTVVVDEHPDIDLAVISVPETWAARASTRFTVARLDAVHPMAVNQSTECFRVLLRQGDHWRLELRYESWVMYRSRAVRPRPDLRVLAGRLTACEPSGARWTADPPNALTPQLSSAADGSGLAPELVEREIRGFLATAPAAWDPLSGR
ncbi:MAG: hypothetical protein JWN62_2201 [Acidimicrobiales bacterium]|nr:hypothetical protein [Acidimicrobiales bacterium]